MKEKEPSGLFDKSMALSYDAQRDRLASVKEALHLCMRALFSKMPSDAHVLCVGVGTGAELVYLAQAFPGWRFTAVEPSGAMLEVCRQRTKALAVYSRCTFHEGYLGSLPETDAFDAATSVLVSHFMVDSRARRDFFMEISTRLKKGAYYINVDLASDMSSLEYRRLLHAWVGLHEYAGMAANIDSFGSKVAMSPLEELATMMKSGGFEEPVLFFQALFIHGWFSQVSANAA